MMIRTKKLLLKGCSFVGFMFMLSSCGQDITLGTRSMTDSLPTVTIPGAPIPTELNLSLDLAIDSEILGIEADSQFLTFARLRDFRLEIQDSSDIDDVEDGAQDSFDFLSALTVSIRATLSGRTVEEVIAFLPDGDVQIGTAARSFDLTVVNTDVLDYLQAPAGYQLVLAISGSVPPDAVVVGGAVRYRVGVGI